MRIAGIAAASARSGMMICAPIMALAGPALAQPDTALSDLIKRQTQEFSEAGQVGDYATMAKYLDPDVVFMNETGQVATRADLVGGEHPPPGPKPADRKIEVTEWQLRPQGHGQTATATFVDVLTLDFHGQSVVYKFRSTETWAKRKDGWKMIASQTMNVQKDPASVTLPADMLDAYVGIYEVDPGYKVEIRREGDGLVASANGGAPVPLKAELRDVLFVPGMPNARRLFERDRAGRVTGYISRRDGTDIVLKKVA